MPSLMTLCNPSRSRVSRLWMTVPPPKVLVTPCSSNKIVCIEIMERRQCPMFRVRIIEALTHVDELIGSLLVQGGWVVYLCYDIQMRYVVMPL